MFKRLPVYMDLVKFAHSVFALPFALISLFVATDGRPGWWVFGWVVVAMVAARTAAMTFNRLVDRYQDAHNPRTQGRPSVTGAVSPRESGLLCFASCAVFVLAAWMLNPLCLSLSPIVLIVLLFYSFTKRFTNWPHVFLGLALGLAPLGAWVAGTGELALQPIPLGLAVLFWVAGFDIIYSMQDEKFDRKFGIGSLVVGIGAGPALWVSRVFHLLTLVFLVVFREMTPLGDWFTIGVIVVSVALVIEQMLVSPTNRTRINMAFFTANGFVGIALLVFALVDVYTG